MIDSAFILRVFGGFGVIGKSGDPGGGWASPSCRLVAGEAEGAERRVAAVAARRSHTTALPGWFQSAVEGSRIKQMLSEMAAAKSGGRPVARLRGGVEEGEALIHQTQPHATSC